MMKKYLIFVKLQTYNGRWAWRPMLLTGILTPLLSTILLGSISSNMASNVRLLYVTSGAITMALVFESLSRVSQNIAFMKQVGALDFYKTVVPNLMPLYLATLTVFFCLSLPAIMITGLFGQYYLHVEYRVSPWIIASLPIASFSVASLGLLVGLIARTPETASSYSMGITLFSLFAAPVFVPPDTLPLPLKIFGLFSPASYASTVIRSVLTSDINRAFFLSMAILTALFICSLLCVRLTENRRFN